MALPGGLRPALRLALALASPAAGLGAAPDPAPLYAQLLAAEVDADRSFRIEGAVLERAGAVFRLDSGAVHPVLAGDETVGAVFEGRGRFELTPALALEQDQLERFTGKRALEERFDLLLLAFSDDTAAELGRHARGPWRDGAKRAGRFLAERRQHLLSRRGFNLAARLLHERLEGTCGFFLAEPRTRSHGVLTFLFDPLEEEQVQLLHWTARHGGFLDTWCSYGGSLPPAPAARVAHYDLGVRLDGKRLEVVAEAVLEPCPGTPRVLAFELHPSLEVLAVADGAGKPLFFAREHTRGKSFEPRLTVVRGEGFAAGDSIHFEIGGDVIEKFPGGSFGVQVPTGWYPRLGYYQRSTYDLAFDTRAKHRVYASGSKAFEAVEGERRLTSFEQRFPVASVAFTFGDMVVEEVRLDGLPPVVVFGREFGVVIGDALLEVGEDVARSLGFFEKLFGPYPFGQMFATRIPYSHGQGFPGLLHLSALTFGGGFRDVDPAFRGHEVAHQWWGHVVGWRTYHDQWLSEGFAVYAGALYAGEALADPGLLPRMLASWQNDILGKGNLTTSLGMTHFGYGREMMRYSDGIKAGPIWLGQRLRSSRGLIDYNLLVYEKGAWVAHMMRTLLTDFDSGSDAAFRRVMAGFMASHRGRNASTEDLRLALEAETGQDMGWFFDQWVYGTAIPRCRWAWQAARRAGADVLRLRVEQEVEDGQPFRLRVPIRVQLADGRTVVRTLEVEQASASWELPLEAAAVAVEFNHAAGVLCEASAVRF